MVKEDFMGIWACVTINSGTSYIPTIKRHNELINNNNSNIIIIVYSQEHGVEVAKR